jgi:hypothetical protein
MSVRIEAREMERAILKDYAFADYPRSLGMHSVQTEQQGTEYASVRGGVEQTDRESENPAKCP